MKYIVIGFPKCGTSTLAKYFEYNDVKCIDFKRKHQFVGKIIETNKSNNQKLFSGKLEKYEAVSQLDYMTINEQILPQITDISLMISQYPDAIFVLNIRNVNDWIKSKKKQPVLDDHSKHDPDFSYFDTFVKYIKKSKSFSSSKTNEELVTDLFNNHIKNIKELFKDISERLVIVDLDNLCIDTINKKMNLFKLKEFPYRNKTI